MQEARVSFMNLDREQLEALKRQIDEDYRLDLAAIDRLLRRVQPGAGAGRSLGSTAATGVTASPSYLAPAVEQRQEAATTPVIELPQERKQDELTGTLRAMFSTVR